MRAECSSTAGPASGESYLVIKLSSSNHLFLAERTSAQFVLENLAAMEASISPLFGLAGTSPAPLWPSAALSITERSRTETTELSTCSAWWVWREDSSDRKSALSSVARSSLSTASPAGTAMGCCSSKVFAAPRASSA